MLMIHKLNACHFGICAVLVLLLFATMPAFSEMNISTQTANQSDHRPTAFPDSGEKLNFPFAAPGRPGITREQALKRLAKRRENKDKNMEPLPKIVYTSTTGAKQIPLSWFRENIEKADKIIFQFQASTGAWIYQDAFVAAFRFEGLCRWGFNNYPGDLKLCEKTNAIGEFKYQMLINYPALREKKPWEWMFAAEEQARSATKRRRMHNEK